MRPGQNSSHAMMRREFGRVAMAALAGSGEVDRPPPEGVTTYNAARNQSGNVGRCRPAGVRGGPDRHTDRFVTKLAGGTS